MSMNRLIGLKRLTPPPTLWATGLLCLVLGPAQAQGIYTCTDAKGRHITSDRPIPECLDREQKELRPSGTVKRTVPPSLTQEERAQLEAKRKADDEKQARLAEEKRKERALVVRYPNQTAHDKARAEALAQVDEVIAAVQKRETELEKQHKDIADEMEFYKKDPSKAPVWLKRRQEDNAQQRASQSKYLADQQQEKIRINARFDEELAQLRKLWGQPVPAP
jgi:DNA repair exonuclease SbcCD ATPase subunit